MITHFVLVNLLVKKTFPVSYFIVSRKFKMEGVDDIVEHNIVEVLTVLQIMVLNLS